MTSLLLRKFYSKLQLALNIKRDIPLKRTIMSRLYGQGHNGVKAATNAGLPKTIMQKNQNPLYDKMQSRCYKIQISNTNPMNSSHEQSQVNPLIQLSAKKVIQHPAINVAYCEKTGCETKTCDTNKTDCGEITKVEAIGHGTHSDSTKVLGSEHLSNTDFMGDRRPQYAVFYTAEKRVPVTNAEATSHDAATKEVNTNQEMLNNINMYKKLND